jgi:NTP pyrophosphatase (non-canonical NTP hydrolase)
MNLKFIRPGVKQAMARFVEECGEVLAAVGKTQRFGLDSVNPLLPREQQETNRKWVQRELKDLRDALNRLEDELEK